MNIIRNSMVHSGITVKYDNMYIRFGIAVNSYIISLIGLLNHR